MSVQTIISIDRLCFGYDTNGTLTLDDLSLEIPAGTVTAILGPNGTGKTTLLHVILGMLKPQRGEITIENRPQSSYSRQELSRLLGLVLQSEYIPFNFSTLDYVLMGRTPYLSALAQPSEQDYVIAFEALKILNLDYLGERSVTELSGGERQMVMLARALTQQPRILLLDEPTSHLDLSNKGRILRILRNLAKSGVTVIFTTHDPEMVVSVAQYVILMGNGRVLDCGPVDQTLTPEKLTATYGAPVQVVQINGRRVVLLDESVL
jgi:iron complex transport system ATP-binding protein